MSEHDLNAVERQSFGAQRSRQYSEKYTVLRVSCARACTLSCSYIRDRSADEVEHGTLSSAQTHGDRPRRLQTYSRATFFPSSLPFFFSFFLFLFLFLLSLSFCDRTDHEKVRSVVRVAARMHAAGMLRGRKRGPCPGQCCIPATDARRCTRMHRRAALARGVYARENLPICRSPPLLYRGYCQAGMCGFARACTSHPRSSRSFESRIRESGYLSMRDVRIHVQGIPPRVSSIFRSPLFYARSQRGGVRI